MMLKTGEISIIDLGLSKECLPGGEVLSDLSQGTLSYMAPELFHHRESKGEKIKYSRASEVFALGVVIQRILFDQTVVCDEKNGSLKEFKMNKHKSPNLFSRYKGLSEFLEKMRSRSAQDRPAIANVVGYFNLINIAPMVEARNKLNDYWFKKIEKNNSRYARFFSCLTNGKSKETAAKKMLDAINGEAVIFTDSEVKALREKNSRLSAIISRYEQCGNLPDSFIQAERRFRLEEAAQERRMSTFRTIKGSII